MMGTKLGAIAVALLIYGCGASSLQGGSVADAADALEVQTDVGGLAVRFESPEGGTVVAGVVTVHVVVDSLSPIATLVVRAGDMTLADSDNDPSTLTALFDTVMLEDGPLLLAAEATDETGRSGGVELEVEVDNHVANTASGVVSLGYPVAGARIEVRPLDDTLTPGAPVAEGLTAKDGWFEVELPESTPLGLMLVRAAGKDAHYRRHGAGEGHLGLDDEITAVVRYGGGDELQGLSVNGLTTMARSLAGAYVTRKGQAPDAAVETANRRLGDHLWRPGESDPRRVGAVMPGEPGFDASYPPGALGLLHIGLAGLAARWADESGVPVTPADAVGLLSMDLADGLFDGLAPSAGGFVAPIEIAETAPLDADSTRSRLAGEIHEVAGDDEALVAALLAPGGLLGLLALDDGPLYPPGAEPEGFDPEAPTLVWLIEPPNEGALITGGFTAQVQAVDASGIASLAVTSPASVQKSDLGDGIASIEVDTEPLPDGKLVLEVVAKDPSGNEATLTRTLHLDRTPPEVSVGSVGNTVEISGERWTTFGAVVLTGEAIDPAPTGSKAAMAKSVRVEAGGPPVEVDVDKKGKWSCTVPLVAGKNTLVVTAADALGNSSEGSPVSLVVLQDGVAPTITIESPATPFVATQPAYVSGTVEDGDGVGGVNVTLRNLTTGQTNQAAAPDGEVFSGYAPPGMAAGNQIQIQVSAADALGNTSDETLSLTLDDVPPVLTVAGLTGGVLATTSPEVVLAGTLTDATSGPVGVALDTPSGAQTAAVGDDGTWSLDPVALEPDNPQSWTVTGFDVAGNSSVVSLQVLRDTTAPDLVIESPSTQTTWISQESSVLLDGTAFDAGAGVAELWMTVNGAAPEPVEPSSQGGSGTVGWTQKVYLTGGGTMRYPGYYVPEDGAYVVTAWAVDAVGNVGAKVVRTIYRDSQAPVVGLETSEFFGEGPGAFAAEKDGLKLQKDVAVVKQVGYEACGAEARVCGSFQKFPHRLGCSKEADLKTNNLPYFQPLVTDNASALSPSSSVVVSFHFVVGGQNTPETPAPSFGIPVAAPYLWPDGPDVPDGDTPLPSAVVITAVDPAGNTTIVQYSFSLALRTPPLYSVVVATPPLVNGAPLSFDDQKAHLPFGEAGSERVVVARLFVPNYYPLAMTVDNSVSWGQVQATLTSRRTYLDGGPGGGSGCSLGLCRYEFLGLPLDCDLVEPWEKSSTVKGVPTLSAVDADTGADAPLDDDGRPVLAPNSNYYVDVAVDFHGACLLAPPTSISIYDAGAGSLVATPVYLHDGVQKSCDPDSFAIWKGDSAVCRYGSSTTMCGQPGLPPCSYDRSWAFIPVAKTIAFAPAGSFLDVGLSATAPQASICKPALNQIQHLKFESTVLNKGTEFNDSPFSGSSPLPWQ